MQKIVLALLLRLLSGCAQIPMPTGSKNQRTFTLRSDVTYQVAYRLIAKQMCACYRVIGVFGNGYDVQADIDTQNKSATIEYYYVGITGAEKPEESKYGKTILIEAEGEGSRVTVSGTTPLYVYGTARTIPDWLAGETTCIATGKRPLEASAP